MKKDKDPEILLSQVNLNAYSMSHLNIDVIEYFNYIKNTDDFNDLNKLVSFIWSFIDDNSLLYTSYRAAKLLGVKAENMNFIEINNVKFVKINPKMLDFIKVKKFLNSIFHMKHTEYFFLFLNSKCFVYPHEDFWFGIIDENLNKKMLEMIVAQLNKNQCSVFHIDNS